MPPSAVKGNHFTMYECQTSEEKKENTIIEQVAHELECLRSSSESQGSSDDKGGTSLPTPIKSCGSFQPFPSSCLKLLQSLPGNRRCVDCNCTNPDWASISYGCLLCLQCSGRHRGLGVNVSKVRSVSMDNWSHADILCMLEGGNEQLSRFFDRHELSHKKMSKSGSRRRGSPEELRSNPEALNMRYKTKAALFYRVNLSRHVESVISSGKYKGREVSRNHNTKSKKRISPENKRRLARGEHSSPPQQPQQQQGLVSSSYRSS